MGNGEKTNALRDAKATSQHGSALRDARNTREVDTCECGPMTRATRGCECGAEQSTEQKDENSFYFFETLLDEAHPSSKMFYDHLLEAALLHRDKQRDYGKETDPFANVRASEEWGIPGWVGCMVRANDKIRRLQTLATEGTLTNEAAKDSFIDLAVYALIGLCLYEESLVG